MATVVPGFLFVEKAGYRFHGQRCDRAEPQAIMLVRRNEPAETCRQRLLTQDLVYQQLGGPGPQHLQAGGEPHRQEDGHQRPPVRPDVAQ